MTTPASGAQPTQASSTSPAPAAAAPGAGAAVTQPAAAPAGSGAPVTAPAAAPAAPNMGKLVIENRKLQQQLKELGAKAGKADELDAMIAALKDPEKRYELLDKHGIKYDEWTERILRQAGVKPAESPAAAKLSPEVEAALAELKELKGKIDTRESAETKAAQERQTSAARAEAKRICEELGADAELVATFGGYDAVVREWLRVHEETGAPPDDKEIAKSVEQKLEATLGSQLGTLLGSKKGKALIVKALGVDAAKLDALIAAAKAGQNGKGGTHQASPQANSGQTGGGGAPTLNNAMSAEPGGTEIPFHKLSPKQKRELAGQRAKARVTAGA